MQMVRAISLASLTAHVAPAKEANKHCGADTPSRGRLTLQVWSGLRSPG